MHILIPCKPKNAQGFLVDTQQAMRTVGASDLERWMETARPSPEEKRVQVCLRIADAHHTGDSYKTWKAAREYVRMFEQTAKTSWREQCTDVIANDPLSFVMGELNRRSPSFRVQLWRDKGGDLGAGIYCEQLTDAMTILVLRQVVSGKPSAWTVCAVCGEQFKRIRGGRRLTCSDKCRKVKSRSHTQSQVTGHTPFENFPTHPCGCVVGVCAYLV